MAEVYKSFNKGLVDLRFILTKNACPVRYVIERPYQIETSQDIYIATQTFYKYIKEVLSQIPMCSDVMADIDFILSDSKDGVNHEIFAFCFDKKTKELVGRFVSHSSGFGEWSSEIYAIF